MTLQNGVDAPDFTLKTRTPDGLEDVCLSEHKGQQNVVLLFFPFAFTGVCTEEACSVRDDLSAYDDLDAKVYGISVDSPFAQEAMSLKESLNFPLLSDFNKKVSSEYGVLYDNFIGFEGVSKGLPSLFQRMEKFLIPGLRTTPSNYRIFRLSSKLLHKRFPVG